MAPKFSTYLAIYLCILSHLIYCNACVECQFSQPDQLADGESACKCPVPSPPSPPVPPEGDDTCDDCPAPQPAPAPADGDTSDGKHCPRDALKFGICAGMLGQDLSIGDPPETPCCSLMHHMADFELGLCLCTAIKANVLGMNLNVPLSFNMLINACGQKTPPDFQCE